MSCGSPRVNAKLYPTVMSEMARTLRPGTGRAVLLVTQPHLLGLREIQRERPKDKKKRFKGMRHPNERGGSNKPSESEDRGGKVSSVDAAAGGAQQAEESAPCNSEGVGEQASRDLKAPAPAGVAVGATGGGSAVAPPPPPLWQLRARHAVNIGGLISWILVLGRTDEPPPPPRPGRRNRFVGLKSYCKRREDGRLVREVRKET